MKTNDSDVKNDVVFNELSLGFRRYSVGAETGRLVLRHADQQSYCVFITIYKQQHCTESSEGGYVCHPPANFIIGSIKMTCILLLSLLYNCHGKNNVYIRNLISSNETQKLSQTQYFI